MKIGKLSESALQKVEKKFLSDQGSEKIVQH